MHRFNNERGTALLETALTLPLILLVSVGIFEFGRAYQIDQVITNAAREGARVAVLPGSTVDAVKSRVQAYLDAGRVPKPQNGSIDIQVVQNVQINIGSTTATGSRVTVNYPFSFFVLNPVAKLVTKGSTLGRDGLTMSASAEMRNE